MLRFEGILLMTGFVYLVAGASMKNVELKDLGTDDKEPMIKRSACEGNPCRQVARQISSDGKASDMFIKMCDCENGTVCPKGWDGKDTVIDTSPENVEGPQHDTLLFQFKFCGKTKPDRICAPGEVLHVTEGPGIAGKLCRCHDGRPLRMKHAEAKMMKLHCAIGRPGRKSKTDKL